MATMISEVYEAFRSVGVPEERARAAAEALTEDQMATKADIAELERATKADSVRLERELKASIAKLEKELVVIKWMLGVVIAAVVLPLFKNFIT